MLESRRRKRRKQVSRPEKWFVKSADRRWFVMLSGALMGELRDVDGTEGCYIYILVGLDGPNWKTISGLEVRLPPLTWGY